MWLICTFGLGLGFLLIKGFEWSLLMATGFTISSGLPASTYYVTIGAHGIHVGVGLVAVLYLMIKGHLGRFSTLATLSSGKRGTLLALRRHSLDVSISALLLDIGGNDEFKNILHSRLGYPGCGYACRSRHTFAPIGFITRHIDHYFHCLYKGCLNCSLLSGSTV